MKFIYLLGAALLASVALNVVQFVNVTADCGQTETKAHCSRETAQWYLDCTNDYVKEKPANCDMEKLRDTALDCKSEIHWEANYRREQTPKGKGIILNNGKSY